MKEKLQFGPTLSRLLAQKNWTATRLAKAIGVSHVAVGNFLGGQLPKSEHLFKLSEVLGVSMEELLTGVNGNGESSTQKTPRSHGGPYWGSTNLAPIVAFARGGEGAFPEDSGGDLPHIPVACKDPNTYVLELQGDSMEPVYHPGDLLIIAPNLQFQNGDLVILKTMEDETFFKKLQTKGKDFRLYSFNPNHPVLDLTRSEVRKIHVVHSILRGLKGKIF